MGMFGMSFGWVWVGFACVRGGSGRVLDGDAWLRGASWKEVFGLESGVFGLRGASGKVLDGDVWL